MKLSQALKSLGRPVAYYPSLVKLVGSVKAAILLGQLFFWQERTEADDGFFFKSVIDLQEETGLSYKEQLAARAELVRPGLMTVEYRRARHRLYYRIDLEVLDRLWSVHLEASAQREDAHLPKEQMPSAQREDRYQVVPFKTTEEIPPPPPRGGLLGFDRFWESYPRKVGIGVCRRLWSRLKPDEVLVARMLAAIDEQKRSEQWGKDHGQFIPLPATWLGQARWEDEPYKGLWPKKGEQQ